VSHGERRQQSIEVLRRTLRDHLGPEEDAETIEAVASPDRTVMFTDLTPEGVRQYRVAFVPPPEE
jgi:hypothetical protein